MKIQCKNGLTALHWAAGRGLLDAIKVTLETPGIDKQKLLGIQDKNGYTALCLAMEKSQANAIKVLLKHQINTVGLRGNDKEALKFLKPDDLREILKIKFTDGLGEVNGPIRLERESLILKAIYEYLKIYGTDEKGLVVMTDQINALTRECNDIGKIAEAILIQQEINRVIREIMPRSQDQSVTIEDDSTEIANKNAEALQAAQEQLTEKMHHAYGKGAVPHRPYLYGDIFEEYYIDAMNKLLALRLHQNLKKSGTKINVIAAQIIKNSYSVANAVKTLTVQFEENSAIMMPCLVQSSEESDMCHWIGMVLIKSLSGIGVTYLDSENKVASIILKESIVTQLQKYNPGKEIRFGTKSLERQKYNNCGPEVIENLVYFFTGNRATQEGAIYIHSLLLENTLLDQTVYQLKIEQNNHMIKFLSNQVPLGVDRLMSVTCPHTTMISTSNDAYTGSIIISNPTNNIGTKTTTFETISQQRSQSLSMFQNLIHKLSDKLDISWQYKQMLYRPEVNQFNNIVNAYNILTAEGHKVSINILKDLRAFKKSILIKVHPDKGGNKEDFDFMQALEEKFNKSIDITKTISEKLSELQPIIYKINIGFRAIDTVIDATRAIYEPVLGNVKKVIIDTTYLYSMYHGVNSYSFIISGADILYQTYKGDYIQALQQSITTLGYLVLPFVINSLGVPYLGFAHSLSMAIYSGYNVIDNGYSFCLEFNSSEFELRSGAAYKALAQTLLYSLLQFLYTFKDVAKGYDLRANNIKLDLAKVVIKAKLEAQGEPYQKTYEYVYNPLLEEKYRLSNQSVQGRITREEVAKHSTIISNEQSYENCMGIKNILDNIASNYDCSTQNDNKILDHVFISVSGYNHFEVVEYL